MSDRETLDFYEEQATAYRDRFTEKKADADLLAFMAELPPGGRVLDFGSGPGRSAAVMRTEGFEAEAWDGAEAMVDLAREAGVPARQAQFEDLDADNHYDGIWANFSLLHAERAALPGILARIARALRSGGCLHLGMKIGTGAARDRLGRFYTYYSLDELTGLLADAGLTVKTYRLGEGKGFTGDTEPFVILRAHA